MKRTGLLALCIMLAACLMGLTGCGSSPMPYDGVDASEYVKVGEYKGLETEPIKVNVTDKEVADAVQAKVKGATENVDVAKGKKIENGDIVNIDYVGTIDGKEFEGGADQGYDLTIGTGTFISGFEEGLIGKKVGEEGIKLNLVFPLDYGAEDLAGKDVVFTVKVNSAVRPTTPEYDEAFIKSQGDYKTKDEYEEAVKQELIDKKTQEAEAEQRSALWDQVLTNSEVIKYPEDVLNNYLEFNSKQLDDFATEYGVTRDEVLTQYGFASEEDFEKVNDESSKLRVEQELIMKYISDTEGLEITDEQMETVIQDLEKQGYDDEKVLQATGRSMDEYAYLQVMFENTLDFIVKNAKTK